MKKGLIVLSMFICLLSGCNKTIEEKESNQIVIPTKANSLDNFPSESTINTMNLDQYMFREDVQYVDLRSMKMIANEGHVAGFEFIPFYSLIASFTEGTTLYQMKGQYNDKGEFVSGGQVGGFVAQYKESKRIVEALFSKDKYIFLISQGGSESSYMINLLIQLGYDGNLLYNVGGVMNNEGIPSYSSIKTNKYFVQGHGDLNMKVSYDFMNELTPITNN